MVGTQVCLGWSKTIWQRLPGDKSAWISHKDERAGHRVRRRAGDHPWRPYLGSITSPSPPPTCAFCDRSFGARTHLDYAPNGKSLVRQMALGGALLSIHQAGNGLELVARLPSAG
jgi:hypothetical protein